MRITTDEQDKLAYVCWPLNDLEIVRNGQPDDLAITADDEEGYVIVFNRDLVTPEIITGKVEFVPKNERGEKLLAALRKRWSILAPQRG